MAIADYFRLANPFLLHAFVVSRYVPRIATYEYVYLSNWQMKVTQIRRQEFENDLRITKAAASRNAFRVVYTHIAHVHLPDHGPTGIICMFLVL